VVEEGTADEPTVTGGDDAERREEWSADEASSAAVHQLAAGAAVLEAPPIGHREPDRVTLAQVVRVRVTLVVQIVQPHDGARVLVREGDDCQLGTPCP